MVVAMEEIEKAVVVEMVVVVVEVYRKNVLSKIL